MCMSPAWSVLNQNFAYYYEDMMIYIHTFRLLEDRNNTNAHTTSSRTLLPLKDTVTNAIMNTK